MRKNVLTLLICVLFILTNTFFQCEKEITVSLYNETVDTLYACSNVHFKRIIWPEVYWRFDTISPFSNVHGLFDKSDLEMYGINVFVVRKSVVDSLMRETVINRHLYDTVYHYNYDELEFRDFKIKVVQQDLNVH